MHISLSSRVTLLASLAPMIAAQTSPVKVVYSEFIAQNQTSLNIPRVLRDGGYQGRIGDYFVQTYADTVTCATEDEYESGKGCNATFAANTIAANSYLANEVIDFDSTYPATFCNSTGSNTDGRLHISNIVPTGQDTGVVWYVSLGDCPNVNGNGCAVGAGVATVALANGNVTCQATPTYWDPNTEPLWGAAVGPQPDDPDQYIYLSGQLNYPAQYNELNYVYIARVPASTATDYSTYEYWNGPGQGFTSTRLHYPNDDGFSPAAVAGGDRNTGSFSYNNYYNQYFMLAIDNSSSAIIVYTSENPQGPYVNATLYSDPYLLPLYAPAALTSYDESGKNLTIAVSVFERNAVGAVVKVTFE